jgi:hypothetical protein
MTGRSFAPWRNSLIAPGRTPPARGISDTQFVGSWDDRLDCRFTGREASALTGANSFTAAKAIFASNAAANTFRDRPIPDPLHFFRYRGFCFRPPLCFWGSPSTRVFVIAECHRATAGTPSNCTDSSQGCHYPSSTRPWGSTTSTRTSVMPSCDLLSSRLTICVCPQKTISSDAKS